MKALKRTVVLAALVGIGYACKTPKQNLASLKDDETSTTGRNAQATITTLQEISQKIASGNWEWEVNPEAFNEHVSGMKLERPEDAGGIPYAEVQVCADADKRTIGGKPACMVYDNLATYDYVNAKRVAPFGHIIPQRQGDDQPDMDKYIQEGDVAVYAHTERRGGSLDNSGMQWRTTHAATIIKKDGKLGTADTPSGYARPFDGNDETPIHIFRFMPKDESGQDVDDAVAQKYRKQIGNWARLGFNQFTFTGQYDSAAGQLKGPKSIANFGEWYIKAATGQPVTKCNSSTQAGCFPMMYCAWFVYTNVNLAWMHPLNPAGLAAVPGGANLATASLNNVWKTKSDKYAPANGSTFMDNDPGLKAHNTYAFEPMTAYGLIHGFLVKVVGEDVENPAIFVGRAMNKAGLLQALAGNPGIVGTLSSQVGFVPNFDAAKASEINAKIPQMLGEFAGLYKTMAEKVQGGQMTVQDAIKQIYDLRDMKNIEKDAAFQDYTKRWVPPYIYFYIAENFHSRDVAKRPVMAYIGTVYHEKFLKRKGQAATGPSLVVTPSRRATDRDKALDKAMYKAIGMAEKDDMKGYQFFFECLADKDRANCGSKIKRHLNQHERDALLTYSGSWKVAASLDGKEARTRNTFGLDAVLFRRLLASYFNDPAAAFRPNILASTSANPAIQNSTSNFRLLMSAEHDLHDEQAPAASYASGERVTAMPCLTSSITDVPQGTPLSCAYKITVEAAETFTVADDPADGNHGTWPATRHPVVTETPPTGGDTPPTGGDTPTGGGGNTTPQKPPQGGNPPAGNPPAGNPPTNRPTKPQANNPP